MKILSKQFKTLLGGRINLSFSLVAISYVVYRIIFVHLLGAKGGGKCGDTVPLKGGRSAPGVVALLLLIPFTPAGSQVIFDNFNDNTINSSLWTAFNQGSGPTVVETNSRLEITHPANSTGEVFLAGYTSVCQLTGDFDIQVDYQLLVWPPSNGVRVNLVTDVGAVNRSSLGASADFPGQQPRENYVTDFFQGFSGVTFVPTNDQSGSLRLVRTGSTATGYYFSGGNWVPIASRQVGTADVQIGLHSHSHDYAFTDQEVKIAYDNFIVNQGQLIGSCIGSKELTSLSPATLWVGLKNSDDQGTQFDLRTEVYINDTLVAEGENRCITGVTRNPNKAKEVSVDFGSISEGGFASGDELSLRVLTRIGTNPDDTKCSGHNNAVGLRLYYDAVSRPSRFGAEIPPDALRDLFLHSIDTDFFLNAMPPNATSVKFKDSSFVNFIGGNPWKEIGIWSMPLP